MNFHDRRKHSSRFLHTLLPQNPDDDEERSFFANRTHTGTAAAHIFRRRPRIPKTIVRRSFGEKNRLFTPKRRRWGGAIRLLYRFSKLCQQQKITFHFFKFSNFAHFQFGYSYIMGARLNYGSHIRLYLHTEHAFFVSPIFLQLLVVAQTENKFCGSRGELWFFCFFNSTKYKHGWSRLYKNPLSPTHRLRNLYIRIETQHTKDENKNRTHKLSFDSIINVRVYIYITKSYSPMVDHQSF